MLTVSSMNWRLCRMSRVLGSSAAAPGSGWRTCSLLMQMSAVVSTAGSESQGRLESLKWSRKMATATGATAKPMLPPAMKIEVASTSRPLGATEGTIPPATGWKPEAQKPESRMITSSIHTEFTSVTAQANTAPVRIEAGMIQPTPWRSA